MGTILVGIPIEILKGNSPLLEKQTNVELLRNFGAIWFLRSELVIISDKEFFKNFGADGSDNCVPEDLFTIFNLCFFLILPCSFSVLFLSKDCAGFQSCIDELTQKTKVTSLAYQ